MPKKLSKTEKVRRVLINSNKPLTVSEIKKRAGLDRNDNIAGVSLNYWVKSGQVSRLGKKGAPNNLWLWNEKPAKPAKPAKPVKAQKIPKSDKAPVKMDSSPTTNPIESVFDEIKDLVVSKNKSYGNSVLDPIRVFSKADKKDLIKVRIDDKLSRLYRGNADIETDEDIVKDLVGYLVLLLVAMRDD